MTAPRYCPRPIMGDNAGMEHTHTAHLDAAAIAADPAASRAELERARHPLDLTANGEAVGVVMSRTAYENLQAIADAEMIRLSHEQYLRGEGRPMEAFLDELRAELIAIKRAKGQ